MDSHDIKLHLTTPRFLGIHNHDSDHASFTSDLTLVNSQRDLIAVPPRPTLSELDVEEPQPRSRFRLVAILTALYLSLFLAALDQSIVATAIPTITSDLKSSKGYVWIGSAYLLATAAGGPIWANLSDIFGRKPILLVAVFLFFGTSIICALASSMQMLIAARAFQGVAGGGLIQLVNITISDLFSVRTRSLYLGLLEVMWAIAGGIGPVLGGAFTQLASWRYCFWINLPIAGFTFIVLFIFLDVHNPRTPIMTGIKAIDWIGIFFILTSTIMVFIGMDLGGVTYAWNSIQVICLLTFGSVLFVCFIVSEKYAAYPLIPLDLLKTPSNVAALLVCLFHGMVYLAQEFYLPLYFQSALAASPVRSGALTIPITLGEALMGIVCGVVIHRTGRYLEVTYFGCALMLIGVALYTTFTATTSIAMIIGIELIAGFGAGCLFEPPMIALHAFVSQDKTASATATLGFTRNVAQSFSLVIGGVIFQNSVDTQVPILSAKGVPSSVTDLLSNGAAAANVMVVSTISDMSQQLATREAFVWSLRNMWILYACLSGAALVSSLFIGKRKLEEKHTETKTGLS